MSYSTKLGLPNIIVTFQSAASTAMIRSERGVAAIILNDENFKNEDGVTFFNITDISDIPGGISAKSEEYIRLALGGTPKEVDVFLIPPAEYEATEEVVTSETVETTTEIESEVFVVGVEDIDDPELSTEDHYETQTVTVDTTTIITSTTIQTTTITATVTLPDVLAQACDLQWNWICYPTGTAQEQKDLADWVKSQRKNKNKTFKAVVANVPADDEGVVNFTTENIKIINPAYTDALTEAGGVVAGVDASIPKYLNYSTAEFTPRLAGVLAGIALSRSATYYQLADVVSCARYNDIESHIDAGELCLFDENDGNGVKIARGNNSLITFTATHGTDFRFIKIIEALDLIKDDISRTFKNDYCGKVINSYENKNLLISAINIYLNQLASQSILGMGNEQNYVEMDLDAILEYAKMNSIDTTDYSDEQVRQINTAESVFLRGFISPLNSMESLELNFILQ